MGKSISLAPLEKGMINRMENIYTSSQTGNESGLGVMDAVDHFCLFALAD